MKKHLFILFFLIVPIITWGNESILNVSDIKLDIADVINKSDIAPTIVGEDDREEITNENAKDLEKAVVVLGHSYDDEIHASCSGAMVGPNVVLTAAHCLVQNGKYKKDIEVFAVAADKSESTPSLSAKSIELYIPKEYIELSRESLDSLAREYDYGVVVLDKPIGLETGWFKLNAKSNPRLKKIITMGYSGDKPDNTLWRSEGRTGFVVYDNNTFKHNADTLLGNSGSPIVMKKRPDEIIGIHISHLTQAGDYAPNGYPNTGLRITKDIIDLVTKYNKRNGPYLTSKD